MKLWIDADVLVDVLQKRKPHHADSAKVWKLCETKQSEGFISTLTFANIMYVMRKELSPKKIEAVLQQMMLIFSFTPLTDAELVAASRLDWDDFEDAVQNVSAEKVKADYIITRNIKHFSKSKIPSFTPSEFLARL